MALLKSLASGPGFCRVPDTSGVDDTFFLLIFDARARAGWTRSTRCLFALEKRERARARGGEPTDDVGHPCADD